MIWNQLRKEGSPYGVDGLVLLYSVQPPVYGNIAAIEATQADEIRACDVNDFFKSHICLFTNVINLKSYEVSQTYSLVIQRGDIQLIILVKDGKIQDKEKLEQWSKMIKYVRKEYKDQLDTLGKISHVKHPSVIDVQIFYNFKDKEFEAPFLSKEPIIQESEIVSYFQYETDPEQMLTIHMTKLSEAQGQILYYDQPCISPTINGIRRFNEQRQFMDKVVYTINNKIMNIHHFMSPKTLVNSKKYQVQGDYLYSHYLQDGIDDKGWGCAYRSFQSVLSWLILNKHCEQIPIPSIRDIQKILIEMGDKPVAFHGSSEWIGAFEVNLLIQKLTGIDCKIVNIQKGSDIKDKLREFQSYFEDYGAPIMFGGGLYAYTLLGIEISETEERVLILDPHYTASDTVKNILEKGGVAWKKLDMFEDKNFYNFCLPIIKRI